MREFTQSGVWQRTLAQRGRDEQDPDREFRARLSASFSLFRDRARELAAAIPEGIRHLTVHDQTHLDALWELADIIAGPSYSLTPTEGYVLGGGFLLHDLGMALASYPGGMPELESNPSWQDAAVQLFRRAHGWSPSAQEMATLAPEIRQEATERFLRVKHAEHAEALATMEFRHRRRDTAYYLIADEDLRQKYGPLIGRIGYSTLVPGERGAGTPEHADRRLSWEPAPLDGRPAEAGAHRSDHRRLSSGRAASSRICAGSSPAAGRIGETLEVSGVCAHSLCG
jgi:hypothetical protein